MKFAVASTLAAIVAASAKDFPRFDSFHANCALQVTYQESCGSIYTLTDFYVRSWANGGPSGGLYEVFEQADPVYIWTTRTTPVKKYVDDQIFEYTQTSAGCVVNARSRSQSNSVYDYSTNYCNMWNVFTAIGPFENLNHSQCAYPAEDPVATCAVY